MANRLLVVDDDHAGCRLVAAIFAREGFDVQMAHDGAEGIKRATATVAAAAPDVLLLDLRLPDTDGLQVLEKLRVLAPALPVIMLTSEREVKHAVRATQLGAFDYVTKPFDADELVVVVRRALETRALRAEVQDLRRQLGASDPPALQMGPSPEIARVIEQVRMVAASSYSVLVLGETGTGKELVAQALHRESERRQKPFVALDCGAIPETLLESELFGHEKGAFTGAEKKKGRFHLAQEGTLFLDEIGNMPMSLQAKLLRVLESRQVQPVGAQAATAVDVRFVAATNDDLQARATAGHFRADLFFRLAQYTISLPPLRARPSDIPYLAQRFVEEASLELKRPVQQIAPDALAALQKHTWPGNVRELKNVVKRAVLESRDVTLKKALLQPLLATPAVASATTTSGRSLRQVADDAARAAERDAIRETLRITRGNKSHAARMLQTDFKTLHLKMQQLGIAAKDFSV
jgi:DNA-binding NtrC family response regulator